jgi:diguanylate cyclase (GGDEF)-like protein/hemerythrin-like metal-binding protein
MNEGFAISLIIATLSLTLITLVMGTGRKSKPAMVYAAGYIGIAVAFALFLVQGKTSLWIGTVLPNLCMHIAYGLLVYGIRLFAGKKKPWATRFWVYIAIEMAIIISFSVVYSWYPARAVIASSGLIAWSAEFLAVVAMDLNDIPRRFRIPVIVILLGYILFHNVRILFVILTDFSENFFMQPSVLTTVTFVMSLTFTFLWGGSLFILDSARTLSEKDKKAEELEQQAIHDKLTGVFNRQSLDSTLKAEMDRQNRYRNALSLIMLDVDLFKSINDNFGHDEGDRILVEIANRVYSSIRECDLLFRWGGEEFLILAPNTDKAGAAKIAEKLREEISGEQIGPVGTVTASFGVAERTAGETRDDWFSHVDKAMYAAKQNGRNRVEIWEPNVRVPSSVIRIDWIKDWESGVRSIDTEHRLIVHLGNELINLSISESPNAYILKKIDELFSFIRTHFRNEEAILERVGYPELANHRNIHEECLREGKSVYRDYLNHVGNPSMFFNLLVNKIITEHMVKEDSKYFPFVKNYVE